MTEEWVRAAMADQTVVADLLVRLKNQSHATPAAEAVVLPPLGWGRRRSRSKPVIRCAAVLAVKKEQLEPARGSPTTPLSWSGSPSATADGGSEDTSRTEFRSSAARSKGLGATNETSNATPGKRSRKKKTFTELKDEESLLLKERIYLRKEIAALRVTVKEQRATNERLKRVKVDLVSQSAEQGTTSSIEVAEPHPCQPPQTGASHPSALMLTQGSSAHLAPSNSCKVQEIVETKDRFVLPDLNMMATEVDDFGTEALVVMS